MKWNNLLFTLIVIVASILRFWNLGTVPISPDWDEAALGYNAYSILTTGKDEYGKFLPVVLRSFNDYKPALYTYLVIPFVKLFGLNTFSVRFPSAIIGVLMVIGIYYLIREFFLFQNQKVEKMFSIWVPLLTSGLLAISPWHLQFSRVAFESSVGTAMNVFATLFFLKGLRKNWYLLLSAFFYCLSLYAYQAEKVFVPLILVSLVIIFGKNIFSCNKKYILASFIVGLVISAPMIFFTLTNTNSLSRAQGASIFSDKNSLLQTNVQDVLKDKKNNDYLSLFLDNRRFIYGKTIILGYIEHFDINWLFLRGDFNLPRHHAPDMGLLYIFELPFVLTGIYQLIVNNNSYGIDKKIKQLLLSWYLITPIPASITTDVPHAVRTLNFVAIYPIFTAFGIITAYKFYKNFPINRIIKFMGACFLLIIFSLNFFYFLDQYFVQQNYYNAMYWQYGYKQIVDYIRPIQKNYKKIIVSNVGSMDQSYMFFLFYLQYDPRKYLSEGGTYSEGFAINKNKFSNFEFRPFNVHQEQDKDILFVGVPSDFQEEFNRKYSVNYPNSEPAIYIVQH